MPLYIHALVQDADDFHHVGLHAEKHHVRAHRDLAVSRTYLLGRPTDEHPIAQRLTRRLDVARVILGLRLAPTPDGIVPDAFQIGLGRRR